MPLDMRQTEYTLIAGSVYRPGQLDVPLRDQHPAAPVELTYKTVAKALGRKGLRYKDEATLMSLMAVAGLGDALGTPEQRERTAVIVSSNFNNIDTVVQVARQIEAEHVDATSAMALPNASSNAVAATIAIVFQLRGTNLMLCNGDRSGEDAIGLAQQLLAAGRADRVVVVGVEVDNADIRTLFPDVAHRFHGAAAVLLGDQADARRVRPVMDAAFSATDRAATERVCGEASGAEGILRLLLAAECDSPVLMGAHTWQLVSP